IATVSPAGVVNALQPGGVVIFATVSGVAGSANLQINPVPIGSVTIAPLVDTVAQTGQIQLVATVRDSLGNVVTNPQVTWGASDQNTIATVTSSGLVTGVNPGSATITASSGGKSGTNTTVVTASVTAVHVAPPLDTIFASAPGNTVQLIDSAFGSSGYLPGAAVTWSPTSGGVATVNGNGLVTATNTADGSATITATSGSQSGTSTVVVFGHSNVVTAGAPGLSILSVGGTNSTTDNATVTDTFGTNVSAFRMVTWTSRDSSTVKVNNGLSATVTAGTAVTFTAVGTNSSPVTIAVTALDNASAADSISLTVNP
ncbi:MAG: Ig domain-containing protein, partial [Gemmatimonadales bacterium]